MEIVRDTSNARLVTAPTADEINAALFDVNARLDALWDTLERIAALLPSEPPPPRARNY